ncbi:diaminobutyrate acetyltransferase [Paenibacillus doosanensis]|uniref:L-2,4-diaminobutyric acid acetyltransferase n=1 Tax=Paenibacillus konkukensis TaxID=2020716 RepID=A0ABY4RNA0_9BACL|nr:MULTISPECIES: diaminobutyrate acetyltransferase [Paenibacillus]MCS7461710.1 diaminobutyrate acetyltransferase [Paenibacillus doosanensis]UQZ83552.1 L-2,4-diaminobutyric acid acetyltransferase [Paenibacillus konkukensis]
MESPVIRYRHPVKEDGAAVWSLAKQTGALDVNSVYCYILLCDYFRDSCIVAEDEAGIAGFVSAFRIPGKPDRLFVWQIGVAPDRQRRGIAKQLLRELFSSPCCEGVRYAETTISPSNRASQALFLAVAEERGVEVQLTEGYPASMFSEGQQHEDEILFVLGPKSAPGI